MPRVIFHKTVGEFVEFNNSVFLSDYYTFHTLVEVIDKHRKKELTLNNAITMTNGPNLHIRSLVSQLYLMVYSIEWNEAMLEQLSDLLKLEQT